MQFLLLALIAFSVACLLWGWRRGDSARHAGTTVALDDQTLFSRRYRLVGRPDRIVLIDGVYIPEEWKSARRPRQHHALQLGAYLILVEEHFGIRPPYGFLVAGSRRYRIDNTEELRAEVLRIAERIRRWRVAEAKAVRERTR